MEKFDIRSYIMLKDGSSIEIGDYLAIEEKDGSSYTGTLTGFSQYSVTIFKEGVNFPYTVVSTQIESIKRTTKTHSVEIVDNRLFVTNEEGGHGFYDSGKTVKLTLKGGSELIGELKVDGELCDDAFTITTFSLTTGYSCVVVKLADIESVRQYFGMGDKPL